MAAINAGTSWTILLVEDDASHAADVIRALSAHGWSVWHAETAADARAMLRQGRPDLIMLDLTLPDVDGLVFCAHLKTDAPDIPFVICSTATTSEKVLGFKLGAEDVVAKPFELAELEARIEAILRRRAPTGSVARPGSGFGSIIAQPQPSHAAPTEAPGLGLELGNLHIDLARWRITLEDKPLDLTPTEFQLLVFMTRRAGEILSRNELARGVWGDESMSSSRTIDAYIRRISAKLAGYGAPRILSIRGLGYQLATPIVTAA